MSANITTIRWVLNINKSLPQGLYANQQTIRLLLSGYLSPEKEGETPLHSTEGKCCVGQKK